MVHGGLEKGLGREAWTLDRGDADLQFKRVDLRGFLENPTSSVKYQERLKKSYLRWSG